MFNSYAPIRVFKCTSELKNSSPQNFQEKFLHNIFDCWSTDLHTEGLHESFRIQTMQTMHTDKVLALHSISTCTSNE